MNSSFRLRQVNRETWLKLTLGFSDYNYRQSWDFGVASAARIGASCEHVAVECLETEAVVGLADVRIRKIPVVNSGIAYINGGPLICTSNWGNEETLLGIINVLIEEYVVRRKLVLRVAPAVIPENQGHQLVNALISKGFLTTPIKKRTII